MTDFSGLPRPQRSPSTPRPLPHHTTTIQQNDTRFHTSTGRKIGCHKVELEAHELKRLVF